MFYTFFISSFLLNFTAQESLRVVDSFICHPVAVYRALVGPFHLERSAHLFGVADIFSLLSFVLPYRHTILVEC